MLSFAYENEKVSFNIDSCFIREDGGDIEYDPQSFKSKYLDDYLCSYSFVFELNHLSQIYIRRRIKNDSRILLSKPISKSDLNDLGALDFFCRNELSRDSIEAFTEYVRLKGVWQPTIMGLEDYTSDMYYFPMIKYTDYVLNFECLTRSKYGLYGLMSRIRNYNSNIEKDKRVCIIGFCSFHGEPYALVREPKINYEMNSWASYKKEWHPSTIYLSLKRRIADFYESLRTQIQFTFVEEEKEWPDFSSDTCNSESNGLQRFNYIELMELLRNLHIMGYQKLRWFSTYRYSMDNPLCFFVLKNNFDYDNIKIKSMENGKVWYQSTRNIISKIPPEIILQSFVANNRELLRDAVGEDPKYVEWFDHFYQIALKGGRIQFFSPTKIYPNGFVSIGDNILSLCE